MKNIFIQIGKGLLFVVLAFASGIGAAVLMDSSLPKPLTTILACILIGVVYSFIRRLLANKDSKDTHDSK